MIAAGAAGAGREPRRDARPGAAHAQPLSGRLCRGPVRVRAARRPVRPAAGAADRALRLYAGVARLRARAGSIEMLVAARVVQGDRRLRRAGDGARHRPRPFQRRCARRRCCRRSPRCSRLGPLFAPLIGGIDPGAFRLARRSSYSIAALRAALVAAAWVGARRNRCSSPTATALQLGAAARQFPHLPRRRARRSALPSSTGLCWVGIFAFISARPSCSSQYYGVAPDHYGFYFGAVGADAGGRRLDQPAPAAPLARAERVLRWGFAHPARRRRR